VRRRLPYPLQRLLRRYDIHVSHWSQLVEARRQRLFELASFNVLIDVGANDGRYGADVRRAGFGGPVMSYEPLLAAYQRLERRCADDPLWSCRRLALGPEPGEAELLVSEDSEFSSFLAPTEETQRAQPASRVIRRERVPVQRLDDALTEDGLVGPFAVKIDAQGFEHRILEGARATLTKTAYLELELSLVPTYEGAPSLTTMLDLVYGLGFHLVLVENVFFDHATGHALQMNGAFAPIVT
jgi:FkbM family methyltransferase